MRIRAEPTSHGHCCGVALDEMAQRQKMVPPPVDRTCAVRRGLRSGTITWYGARQVRGAQRDEGPHGRQRGLRHAAATDGSSAVPARPDQDAEVDYLQAMQRQSEPDLTGTSTPWWTSAPPGNQVADGGVPGVCSPPRGTGARRLRLRDPQADDRELGGTRSTTCTSCT